MILHCLRTLHHLLAVCDIMNWQLMTLNFHYGFQQDVKENDQQINQVVGHALPGLIK